MRVVLRAMGTHVGDMHDERYHKYTPVPTAANRHNAGEAPG